MAKWQWWLKGSKSLLETGKWSKKKCFKHTTREHKGFPKNDFVPPLWLFHASETHDSFQGLVIQLLVWQKVLLPNHTSGIIETKLIHFIWLHIFSQLKILPGKSTPWLQGTATSVASITGVRPVLKLWSAWSRSRCSSRLHNSSVSARVCENITFKLC